MGEVIDLRKKRVALFTEDQKQRLAASVEDLTDKPQVAVERIEQDLCAQLAENVREVAAVFAEKVASKLTKLLFKG